MNKNCKYCDYISKCSRRCEYDSILCRLNRSFPKIIDKSYEDLQQENKKQKEVIDNIKKYLELNIELIKEQPSNDELTDNFILTRFKSLLKMLEEVSK